MSTLRTVVLFLMLFAVIGEFVGLIAVGYALFFYDLMEPSLERILIGLLVNSVVLWVLLFAAYGLESADSQHS